MPPNSHSLSTKEHHDPRISDEDVSTQTLKSDLPSRVQSAQMSPAVSPAFEQESNVCRGKENAETVPADISQHITPFHFKFVLPMCLGWIPDNWTSSKWMSAIRCAVAEWASLLLLIINPSARAMGQVRSYAASSSFSFFMSQQRLRFWFWSVRRLRVIKWDVFLVFLLTAGMLSPPSDPFAINAERETIILLSVLVAWGSVHAVSECALLHAQPFADGRA